MAPTETRRGDTRRDPRALWILAAALLMLRVGVTLWERAHPAADATPPGMPPATAPLPPSS